MASLLPAIANLPFSVTLPALSATAAYINAKYSVGWDVWLTHKAITYELQLKRLEKQGRVNCFYFFERWATDTAGAARVFLAIPRGDAHPQAQTEWTYAEAYDLVLKYAGWLSNVHGVQKGEIVAMDFTNKPQFIWIWFALWSLGAVPAFINSNLRSKAFLHCVRVSTARLLLLDPSINDDLDDEAKAGIAASATAQTTDTVIVDETVERTILASLPYRAPDSARACHKIFDSALLIFTSGTTGLPKAANVNWGKPLSGMMFWWKLLDMQAHDRYYTAMPLYHSSASILGVCQVLGPGCTVIVAPKFSARTYISQVIETKATVNQYIGESARYMMSAPPSPLDRQHKLRLSFGNGMRPDVWQRYKDRFGIPTIVEFYGATESPGASLVHERSGFMRGAIGRSGAISRFFFGGNSVLVRHDHATALPLRDPRTNFCIKCARDETGELIHPLDPANIKEKFHGYYGNESASSSKVIRDVFKKGDAYYRTGDLQKLDEEGRWWFIDRIGDTFRWKSENVSTAEVSQALGAHPGLREANVYGVELPNHDGRAGCATISLADEHSTGLTAQLRSELAALARKQLPKYAVPLFLRVGKEVEVTGTLKHQKVALRDEGVDPAKTAGSEIYWLPPGAQSYEEFGKREWDALVSGSAKL